MSLDGDSYQQPSCRSMIRLLCSALSRPIAARELSGRQLRFARTAISGDGQVKRLPPLIVRALRRAEQLSRQEAAQDVMKPLRLGRLIH